MCVGWCEDEWGSVVKTLGALESTEQMYNFLPRCSREKTRLAESIASATESYILGRTFAFPLKSLDWCSKLLGNRHQKWRSAQWPLLWLRCPTSPSIPAPAPPKTCSAWCTMNTEAWGCHSTFLPWSSTGWAVDSAKTPNPKDENLSVFDLLCCVPSSKRLIPALGRKRQADLRSL